MSTRFTTSANLGTFIERKIALLINHLNKLGFFIEGFFAGSFIESRNFEIQEEAHYQIDEIQEKILLALELPSSEFLSDTKSVSLHTQFKDIGIVIDLDLNTKKNELEILFWHSDLMRDFKKGDEKYINDNARYARLFLDVVEPFVLKDFTIRCENQYLNEELPKNCLAATIRIDEGFSKQLVDNILCNKFLITYKQESERLPKIHDIEGYISAGFFDMVLYFRALQSTTSIAKLVMPRDKDQLFLYPLEPYKIKTFEGEEDIDMQYYLHILLAMCNQYPIHELRTNIQ